MKYSVQKQAPTRYPFWEDVTDPMDEFTAIPLAKRVHTETGMRVRIAEPVKPGGTTSPSILWDSARAP